MDLPGLDNVGPAVEEGEATMGVGAGAGAEAEATPERSPSVDSDSSEAVFGHGVTDLGWLSEEQLSALGLSRKESVVKSTSMVREWKG